MNNIVDFPNDRLGRYSIMIKQIESFIDERRHAISTLANAAAVIYDALYDVNWAGFYIMHKGALLVGPFIGHPACVDIAVGKGVCGAAVARRETIVVPDVHEFPGHIACDSASRSEIVVPIFSDGRIVGVIDVDSPDLRRFGDLEREYLEKAAALLASLDFKQCGYDTEF